MWRWLLLFVPITAWSACPDPVPEDAVCVKWQAPTENTDGTPLTDLDSFTLYWGAESRSYTESLAVADETQTEALIQPINGQVYIAATASDAEGTESAYSNEILETAGSTIEPGPTTLEASWSFAAEQSEMAALAATQTANSPSPDYDSSPSATFGSTPTQGNTLVAVALNRSGNDAANFSMDNSGWTKRITQNIENGNSTYRRSYAVWTKKAGASEPTTVSVTNSDGGDTALRLYEYAITEDFLEATSDNNGQTADETSVGVGTSATDYSGDTIHRVAQVYIKSDIDDEEVVTDTWTSIADSSDDGLWNPWGSFTFGYIYTATENETPSGTVTATGEYFKSAGSNNGLMGFQLIFGTVSGGSTVSVGQVTETNVAQAISASKVKVFGQVAETDLSQAVTPDRAYGVGQVSESDLAQAVSKLKAKVAGQAVETDVAQPISSTAAILLEQVIEADSAQPTTSSKNKGVGQVAEVDQAQVVEVNPQHRLLGQAVETDASQSVASSKAAPVAQAEETDQSQSASPFKTVGVAQATEADSSQTVSSSKQILTGLVEEFDLAQQMNQPAVVGQVEETNTAQSLAAAKLKALGLSTETNTSQAFTRGQGVTVGQVQEVNVSQAFGTLKTKLLAQVTETDQAQFFTAGVIIPVSLVTETDTAQAVLTAKLRQVQQVSETDLAQQLQSPSNVTIGQVAESDESVGLAPLKAALVSTAEETNLVFSVDKTKLKALGITTETDLAIGLVNGQVSLIINSSLSIVLSSLNNSDQSLTTKLVNTSQTIEG